MDEVRQPGDRSMIWVQVCLARDAMVMGSGPVRDGMPARECEESGYGRQ
jgi:hypothetical protein